MLLQDIKRKIENEFEDTDPLFAALNRNIIDKASKESKDINEFLENILINIDKQEQPNLFIGLKNITKKTIKNIGE